MKPATRGGWTEGRTTFLIIAIGGLYLGVRSERAVHGVRQTPFARLAAAEDSSLGGIRADLRRVSQSESLLAVRPGRIVDPFAPRIEPAHAAAVSRAEEPVVIPTLGGLMYDSVAPVVQLRIGSRRSDWLRPGDVFEGWRVAEVRPASVRIQKNGRTVDLSRSTEGSE